MILARFRCVCAELAESGYDNRTPHFLASLRLIAQKDRERKRLQAVGIQRRKKTR